MVPKKCLLSPTPIPCSFISFCLRSYPPWELPFLEIINPFTVPLATFLHCFSKDSICLDWSSSSRLFLVSLWLTDLCSAGNTTHPLCFSDHFYRRAPGPVFGNISSSPFNKPSLPIKPLNKSHPFPVLSLFHNISSFVRYRPVLKAQVINSRNLQKGEKKCHWRSRARGLLGNPQGWGTKSAVSWLPWRLLWLPCARAAKLVPWLFWLLNILNVTPFCKHLQTLQEEYVLNSTQCF